MKITCNSCGSKYTIADAKVQGKKVKVRCKGCKESILVDGTQIGEGGSSDDDDEDAHSDDSSEDDLTAASAPEEKAEAKPAAPAAKAGTAPKGLWSVNLTDEDSRDMTLDELVAGWKSGLVTSDAYVWKDGMGDWKPILEVGELKLKLGSVVKKAGGIVSSASPTGAKAGGKLDDLFGSDSSIDAPSEVEKPQISLGGGDEKLTGARNDSSVLFSLDSLNAAAEKSGNAQKSSGDDLFAGLGVGSGSLTSNVDLLTAPAKDPPPAPAGNRAQAAPVEASKGGGKGGLIAAILGAAIIIGGAVVFLGGGGEEKKEEAAEAPVADTGPTEAEKKAEEERQKLAEQLKKMEEELKKAKEEAVKKGEDPAAAEAAKKAELEKEKEEAAKKEGDKKAAPGGTTSPAPGAAPAPAPAPSGGAAFDVGAARAALAAAAANSAACKAPGGPTGSGKVQVTFSPSGRVTSSNVISGPFGGTAVGGCVASTFRRAKVPSFSGEPQTVAKSFTIN